MDDRGQRRLGSCEDRDWRAHLPRRNWVLIVIVIGALAVWQYRGGGTSFDVAPDLRHYSRDEFDAAKYLMTASFAIVTTPSVCQRDYKAYPAEAEWKSAVTAWNERHAALMTKVLEISQSTGLSATRGRDAVQAEANRLIADRLERWQGRERGECQRFVAQMNDGLWDLGALPELAALIATVEAAPAQRD